MGCVSVGWLLGVGCGLGEIGLVRVDGGMGGNGWGRKDRRDVRRMGVIESKKEGCRCGKE